jgi:hypothetical protein
MLPDLALIIGAYVLFRMIEVMFFSSGRYSGKGQHIAVGVLAAGVCLVTIICLIDIIMTGSSANPQLQHLTH